MTAYDVEPGDSVHPGDPVTVDRYTAGARVNHWITATCLVLLALSGLALFSPWLFFLTGLFGGGQMTRIIHPWIGVVLAVSFLGLFIRFFSLNFWNRDDTIWMKNLGKVINNKEEGLPELGKYNAGQKLVFWGQSILILALFGSGIVLWDVYFFDYTTIDQKRLAAVVHALCAIGAILIWIVHVYAAIWVKGTLSAMTRGSVTGGWAWKHHRKWFRQEVGKP
jgi:formate dehydrogenase subunit gamma